LREAIQVPGGAGSLEPSLLDRMLRNMHRHTEEMVSKNVAPVVLCPPALRRMLRRLVEHALPQLNVISSAEVPGSATVKAYAVIGA
jgi:flagellar biosynthesis protein FlhA